jgi:hypothetical protein
MSLRIVINKIAKRLINIRLIRRKQLIIVISSKNLTSTKEVKEKKL